MEVKAGYKQTEVGVIPEDWEAVSVGSLASFTSGYGISVAALCSESSDHPVPVFGGNGIAGYTKRPIVCEPVVVVGRVGQRCGQVYLTDGPAWITDNALYPRAIRRELNVRFLALALAAAGLNEVKNRNDLPLVTQSILHAVRIPWPPDAVEQRAIATALSDVDGLLGGLDRLIAKKRDLKQAAMQQLLLGLTRLPGFHGAWEVKSLGELLSYEQPTKYLVKSGEYSDANDIPVLTAGKTFILGYTNEDDGVFENLPVIIFDDFTTATQYVTFPFKAKSSAMKILKPRNASINLRLVYEIIQLIEFKLSEHKRHWISEFQKLKVNMPGEAEQVAIAAVLSDMDAELAALEARREKTRALKQAMMQELLTGRTRLLSLGSATRMEVRA